jgi:hypothetical protein
MVIMRNFSFHYNITKRTFVKERLHYLSDKRFFETPFDSKIFVLCRWSEKIFIINYKLQVQALSLWKLK